MYSLEPIYFDYIKTRLESSKVLQETNHDGIWSA